MASVSWTQSTSGSWTTAGAWSTGAVPLTGDDVTIALQTPVTVTYGAGTLILDSLTTGANDTLDFTGGTLVANNGFGFGGALDIGGGLLKLSQFGAGGYIANNLTMTGGTLQFTNGGQLSGGVLTQVAGTITISHGILTDFDYGNLDSAINGNGVLFINGASNSGSTVLGSGFTIAANTSFDIGNAAVLLQESLAYAGQFTLAPGGILNLNGNALTLSGLSALYGDVRGGSLQLTGNGHLNGLLLDNGALASISGTAAGTGTYNQTGAITLGSGTGTGTLSVGSGTLANPTATGTLRITGNNNILEGSGGGTLNITAGSLVEKTAGSSLAGDTVITAVVNNFGTIDAAVGVIEFAGPAGGATSIIAGTLAGAGTVAFDTGSYLLQGESLQSGRVLLEGSVNVTLASGSNGNTLSYGGNWDQTGGLILVETTLALGTPNSQAGLVALDGGEMKGTATIYIDSAVVHLGQGEDLEGNLTFNLGEIAPAANGSLTAVAETVDQTGAINLGALSDSVDQVTIGSLTAWNLEGSSSITGVFGTITNNGLFDKASGAGNAIVASDLINTATGTILINNGTLSLSGQGTLGGTVGGNGVLEISGAFDIAGGTLLTVNELILDAGNQSTNIQATLLGNLTYSHDFAMEGGTVSLGGNTLTLNGSSALTALTSLGAGSILGGGEVVVDTQATIGSDGILYLAQGADLLLNAATQQLSNVILTGGASAPVLTVGATSTYTIANGVELGGYQNSVVGTVAVQGTLSSYGSNTIAASVIDSGKISVGQGDLVFLGPLSGAGIITLGSGGVLEFDNSNLTTTGVTFGAGGGELYLQSPADYFGKIGGFATGDAVEFGNFGFIGATLALNTSGLQATITETNGSSVTIDFATKQTAGSLALGVGSHGYLSLSHT